MSFLFLRNLFYLTADFLPVRQMRTKFSVGVNYIGEKMESTPAVKRSVRIKCAVQSRVRFL